MNSKGIGPQGLGSKSHNGFWIGSPAKQMKNNYKEATDKFTNFNQATDTVTVRKGPNISVAMESSKNESSSRFNGKQPVESKYMQNTDGSVSAYNLRKKVVSPGKKLTDLSGDGKVTQKDVLIGKGVITSPAKQASKSTDPMARFKTRPNGQKIQESLKKSNETVNKAKANKKTISIGDKISQDWNNQSSVEKSIVQLIDPTGITSYGDVNKAWNDGKTNWDDITEPLGAIPVIGKIPKVIGKGFKIAKSLSTVEKIAKSANEINKVTSKVNQASKISNQGKVAEEVVSAAKKTVKDACYRKVKATYDVFPSAYASGAIAKCRKNK